MNQRVPLMALASWLAAAGGTQAQEFVTYTLTWAEVMAGTTKPVAMPNGRIDPGEGVRIAIRVEITPAVGSTASYPMPPPPGTGIIAGFGSMLIDLLGTDLMGGSWSNLATTAFGQGWPPPNPGFPQPNGDVLECRGGQFVLPGGSANSTNPIENFWRGTWTPLAYSARDAFITAAPASIAGMHHTSILIQYGASSPSNPQYIGKFVPGVFNGTGAIPIVPGPASWVLLAGGCAFLGRRGPRRRVQYFSTE